MKTLWTLLLSLALLSTSGMAGTFYVAETGDDGNDGSTWTQAKRSIQAAVTAAVDGDVILVSNGVYTATVDPVVSLAKSVDIRSVNGPEVTIIDGENSRRCIYSAPSSGGTPICLSGFSIRNGNAASGAGVYKRGVRDFYLSNCVIHANTASSSDGGGIYKRDNSSQMVLTDCIISNNQTARYGAGVYSEKAGRLFMFHCEIVTNISANYGGGIAAISGSSSGTMFELHGCRVANNFCQANSGGGIYSQGSAGSTSVVNHCIVEQNYTAGIGAGIYHRAGGSFLLISNSIIRGNETPYAADFAGAGIGFCGPGRIANCLIAGNKVTSSQGYGGGLTVDSGTNVVDVENVTIVSNSVGGARGGGLAIRATVSSACTLRNTIIYHNTGSWRPNVFVASGAGAVFTNCCTVPLSTSGDQPITPNADNIDSDPALVNLEGGDYRLQSDSPCINTGANMPWMVGAVDLDGHSRLDRFTRQVDRGCYEYVYKGSFFRLQ